MSTTPYPTPEQFLAEPQPDEDFDTPATFKIEPFTPGATFDIEPFTPGAANALESIAVSLQTLADLVVRRDAEDQADDHARELTDQLDREYAELKVEADAKQALLDEVLAICKPSTSKLANAIRAALTPEAEQAGPTDRLTPDEADALAAAQPADPAVVAQPAHDAPLEEWLAFAASRGLDFDPARTNRSMIRTALGISQVEAVA